ncbi:MaoC family dehydratase [Afifella sp. IM 167]|uniref:MaoC family dehydratase n=1 Tax=Afifella sp. IM 167 TaxID=2033586 RepID=UPI001CCD9307|nr:MaoC family dehydratase [Afifella sp. IM 167]MBZ8134804.1 dehydratase [Afifella sp. IM 167]
MPARTIESLADFAALVGEEVAVSDWFEVSQERIDLFARATEDFQWIHVDPKRAAADSPYGGTIAHGFMTLSLLAPLFEDAVKIEEEGMGINYGLNRVRFTAPVPSGARVRGRFKLTEARDLAPGVQLAWDVTVEVEGGERPACVVEWITRRYP